MKVDILSPGHLIPDDYSGASLLGGDASADTSNAKYIWDNYQQGLVSPLAINLSNIATKFRK